MLVNIFNWVELPILVTVIGILIKSKKESDKEIQQCKDALSDFKLHVARYYASMNVLKDVENRLTDHLLRIEKKLDSKGRVK